MVGSSVLSMVVLELIYYTLTSHRSKRLPRVESNIPDGLKRLECDVVTHLLQVVG